MRVKRARIVQRKIKKSKSDNGKIINIKRDRKTRRGECLLIRRMQKSEDSRIKIEVEAKIMHKRAALTRSTMQDQDRDPRKKNTKRS